MRHEACVLSVSWIPSEALTSMIKVLVVELSEGHRREEAPPA